MVVVVPTFVLIWKVNERYSADLESLCPSHTYLRDDREHDDPTPRHDPSFLYLSLFSLVVIPLLTMNYSRFLSSHHASFKCLSCVVFVTEGKYRSTTPYQLSLSKTLKTSVLLLRVPVPIGHIA
jgi:hypothetical protein